MAALGCERIDKLCPLNQLDTIVVIGVLVIAMTTELALEMELM